MGRFWNGAVTIERISILSSIHLSSTGRAWGWFRVWGRITCRGSCGPPLIPHCMTRRADMKIQPYYWELKVKPINNRAKMRLTRNTVSHEAEKHGAQSSQGSLQPNRTSKRRLISKGDPTHPSLSSFKPTGLISGWLFYPRAGTRDVWAHQYGFCPPVIGSSPQAVVSPALRQLQATTHPALYDEKS